MHQTFMEFKQFKLWNEQRESFCVGKKNSPAFKTIYEMKKLLLHSEKDSLKILFVCDKTSISFPKF